MGRGPDKGNREGTSPPITGTGSVRRLPLRAGATSEPSLLRSASRNRRIETLPPRRQPGRDCSLFPDNRCSHAMPLRQGAERQLRLTGRGGGSLRHSPGLVRPPAGAKSSAVANRSICGRQLCRGATLDTRPQRDGLTPITAHAILVDLHTVVAGFPVVGTHPATAPQRRAGRLAEATRTGVAEAPLVEQAGPRLREAGQAGPPIPPEDMATAAARPNR